MAKIKAVTKSGKIKKCDLENMEIRALRQFTNFTLGKVKKIGVQKVMGQYKTQFGASEFYWLKEMYIRVLDNAEEIRAKRVQQSHKVETDQPFLMMGSVTVNGKPLTFDVGS